MMLDQATSENNSAGLRGGDSQVVQFFIVLGDVQNKAIAFIDKVVNKNVSNLSICQCGRKDWDIVLPAPIINAFLIIDLLAKTVYELARAPDGAKLSLFFMHLLENRSQPILEYMIVM